MGRFLGLSALAVLLVSANASLPSGYMPVTGVSQDGKCGDGVTCMGTSYGHCCSAAGVCGSTDDYCGTGCQPLFGTCDADGLTKRYVSEYEEAEKAGVFAREIVKRATRTSSACSSSTSKSSTKSSTSSTTKKSSTSSTTKKSSTSSTTKKSSSSSTSTASITCNPTKTSIIRSKETSVTSWCSSWNANKPHSLSPFTAEGILSPTGVSEACSCILEASGSSSTKATSTSTSKASTSTSKASTTTTKATSTSTTKTTTTSVSTTKKTSASTTSTTLTIVEDAASSSITCNPTKTSVIRAAETSVTAWCSSWNANKPHSLSPFTAEGILSPTGVSEACSCILAASASSSTTAKTTSTTAKTSTTATSLVEDSASITCNPTKTSVIRAAETSVTAWCSSWNANKPHSLSPFTAEGILSPTGVSEACSCILAASASTTSTAKATSTSTSTSKTSTSTSTSKTSTSTSTSKTSTSTTSSSTSKSSSSTTSSSTTSKATTSSTSSSSTSSTASSSTSSACSLKKRKRRRDLHIPIAASTGTVFVA